MKGFLVFGDSIVYGAWDKEGGWVQRLRKFLEEKQEDVLVYNLGVSGDTTDSLLERFQAEAKARLKDSEGVIIISIGVNDSHLFKNKNCVPLEKFQQNIKRLVSLSKEISSKVIFVGLTPVDETKTTPIPWDKDRFYKNEYI